MGLLRRKTAAERVEDYVTRANPTVKAAAKAGMAAIGSTLGIAVLSAIAASVRRKESQ